MSNRQKNLLDLPTTGKIAEVAADIIRAVKADNRGLTNAQLAVMIGAKDADVITRMENAETAKVPASLITAIGWAYGSEYIQPYMGLMGFKAVPIHCDRAIKAMPALTALVAKLAVHIRDGGGLDHVGIAAILPELREADGVIGALRSAALEMGYAA